MLFERGVSFRQHATIVIPQLCGEGMRKSKGRGRRERGKAVHGTGGRRYLIEGLERRLVLSGTHDAALLAAIGFWRRLGGVAARKIGICAASRVAIGGAPGSNAARCL